MLVDSPRGGSGELVLLLALLLNLGDLLALGGRRRDLHAEYYVADLGLGEGGNVHAGRGKSMLLKYMLSDNFADCEPC